MIDHLGFDVSDYEASKRFYQEALAPLGYELLMEFEGGVAGFGKQGTPDFWIATRGERRSTTRWRHDRPPPSGERPGLCRAPPRRSRTTPP